MPPKPEEGAAQSKNGIVRPSSLRSRIEVVSPANEVTDMYRLQFWKTFAALVAAGFNPRAFLAPMALGGKLPEAAETRQPKENKEPEA
ncbi:hypothetical protein J1C56_25270 [Aminobacter anthyllidis]|uniref:Uncharacterized protein n=1 Tax=Aminobacter anthyllidis TaxID=1035067 RepID=A0A9X1AFX8_9HYPH|nr:hypothetical protein [Aminobacter anthyllidis]MBT1158891.1 hypothetical protein [Aminobacter anthyllidis]